MNIYKIYYDCGSDVRLLGLDTSDYSLRLQLRLEDIVVQKVKMNTDVSKLDDYAGVIGFARLPSEKEFEKEDRVIKAIIDEEYQY